MSRVLFLTNIQTVRRQRRASLLLYCLFCSSGPGVYVSAGEAESGVCRGSPGGSAPPPSRPAGERAPLRHRCPLFHAAPRPITSRAGAIGVRSSYMETCQTFPKLGIAYLSTELYGVNFLVCYMRHLTCKGQRSEFCLYMSCTNRHRCQHFLKHFNFSLFLCKLKKKSKARIWQKQPAHTSCCNVIPAALFELCSIWDVFPPLGWRDKRFHSFYSLCSVHSNIVRLKSLRVYYCTND